MSRLAGTLSLEAHDLARLGERTPPLRGPGPRADARLELGASTFRGQALTGGVAHVTLAGADAQADLRLATAAGTAHLTASAQPFAHPASVQVEELRFDHVDLAPWTGLATLASDLNGSASGAFRARSGPDLPGRGSASLELRRSRLGRAAIEGGDLRSTIGEDHARLDGSLRTAGSALALHADASKRAQRTEGSVSCAVPFELL